MHDLQKSKFKVTEVARVVAKVINAESSINPLHKSSYLHAAVNLDKPMLDVDWSALLTLT